MLKDLKIVLFMGILSSISILMLSLGNTVYIEASKKAFHKLYEQIMDNYGLDYTKETLLEEFHKNFKEEKVGSSIYYVSKSVNVNSVVFKAEGPGLWSMLELLLTVDSERTSLTRLEVLSQAETPGLGARMSEPEFLEQFNNQLIRPQLNIVKRASKKNEVDSITGATMTSNAIGRIINIAIEEMDQDIGGGKQ